MVLDSLCVARRGIAPTPIAQVEWLISSEERVLGFSWEYILGSMYGFHRHRSQKTVHCVSVTLLINQLQSNCCLSCQQNRMSRQCNSDTVPRRAEHVRYRPNYLRHVHGSRIQHIVPWYNVLYASAAEGHVTCFAYLLDQLRSHINNLPTRTSLDRRQSDLWRTGFRKMLRRLIRELLESTTFDEQTAGVLTRHIPFYNLEDMVVLAIECGRDTAVRHFLRHAPEDTRKRIGFTTHNNTAILPGCTWRVVDALSVLFAP